MDIIKELESLDFDASVYTEKKISECGFKENVALVGTLVITEKQTKNKKPYFHLMIKDKTGNIASVAWENSDLYKFLSLDDSGKLVKVYGTTDNNGSYTNLVIKHLQFVENTVEENEEQKSNITNLKNTLSNTIERMINPYLKDVVSIALENIGEKLEVTPFSEKTAYNYEGGLLEAIVNGCDIVSAMTDIFNCGSTQNTTVLNEDLLLAGIILGNLGKTRTIKFENDIPTKTIEGYLNEDSMYSIEIATDAIRTVMLAIPEEDKDIYNNLFNDLLHMIASIKGNKQFGSISTPRSKHAMILSNINDIVYTKGLFENLEGTASPDQLLMKAYDNGKHYYLGIIED